jgi:cytidylate kinase
MYRGVAFAVLRDSVDPHDHDEVARVAEAVSVVVEPTGVSVDGRDVTADIRGPEVTSVVSVIAAYPPVRARMRAEQRAWIVNHGGGVVEGRDIGTVVFPDALLKIFLTASPQVRAARRVAEVGGDLEDIARSISERDRIDSSRDDSPLRPAEGSITIDSSGRTIDDVVGEIAAAYDAAASDIAAAYDAAARGTAAAYDAAARDTTDG